VRKEIRLLSIIVLFVFFESALALTKEQVEYEKLLTSIAESRCDTELVKGQDYTLEVDANGDFQVRFIGKKGGGIEGAFKYTKSEWDGRQKVLVQHQANENSNRRDCIRSELRFLRDSYQAPVGSKSRYGAYAAIRGTAKNLAWSSGQESAVDAEDLALERCGHKSCEIIYTIKGEECAAYVYKDLHSSFAKGIGRQAAEDEAFYICYLGDPQRTKFNCKFGHVFCAKNKDRYFK